MIACVVAIENSASETQLATRIVPCKARPELPSGEGFRLVKRGASLALVGNILGGDAIYRGGVVLVGSVKRISCVGCACDISEATVVRRPRGVISPGLINTHDHLTFADSRPVEDT